MRSSKPRVVSTASLLALLVGGAVLLPTVRAAAGSIGGAWVWPPTATANSCRWLRVQLDYDPSNEGIAYLYASGIWGQAPGLQLPNNRSVGTIVEIGAGGYWGRVSNTTTAVYDAGGSVTFTLGPFCGAFNMFDEPPADFPYVIGYLASPGSDTTLPVNAASHSITFHVRFYNLDSGEWDDNETTATVYYTTVHDNDDYLEWYTPDGSGTVIDPLSVGPIEVIPDSGSGNSVYTFRVRYRSGLYSGLSLPPRWRTSEDFPGGYGFIDRGRGTRNVRSDPDSWTSQFNWLYGRTTDTWLDQTGYNRAELNDRGAFEPQVLLVIDGQHWAPHYMQPEDPSDTNYTDGAIFRYTVLPTDYQNFLDNIFLLPFDLPGSDPWDRYGMSVYGRPTSNNYVSLTAGKHTYEFWATDDFAPVKNRAWVQVGWPGNDCHVEYMERTAPEPQPVDGLRSAVARSRFSVFNKPNLSSSGGQAYSLAQLRRFGDTSVAAPDPYGYPYESHAPPYNYDSKNVPNVNPVLTAHPFFGLPGREGGISTPLPSLLGGPGGPWAGGFIENDIPNHTFIPGSLVGANDNPFAVETDGGPNPPWKYTNDDTILPNLFNIFNETAATPFRGGKWTQSSKYTLRINYWHSENRPPTRMQVWIAKVDPNSAPGSITDAMFTPRTMDKADPADNDYTDGVVYQYQVTPDQLPGGGPGDYYYFFRASDGTRETRFPDRPDAGQFGGVTFPPDPSDSGVPRANTGQDWYWFRVNRPLTLSGQTVNPVAGRSGENFVFRVRYTDPDLAVPNPDATGPAGNARGDRPFVARLYVDLYADQGTVTAVPSETELQYSLASGTPHATDEMAGLFVVMQSGAGVRRVYRIQGNNGDLITLHSSGDSPGTLQTDGVQAGDTFFIAQRADMSKEDSTDNDYTDGVWYVFNTATNMILPPGIHRYFFEFADDWGSWLYPDRPDVRVEGQYLRYPNAGEFVGPEVIQGGGPTLVDYRFAPDAVGPGADGVTATGFVFYVTYQDAQNDPPAFIRLKIDGTATGGGTTLELSPENPNDTVYSDGAIYQSPPIRLTDGPHIFRAQASDGTERFPPGYPSPQALPFKGPTGEVAALVGTNSLRYRWPEGRGALFPDGRLAGIAIDILDDTGTPTGTTLTIADNAGDTLTFAPGTSLAGITVGTRFTFDAAPGPIVALNTPPQLVLPEDDNNPQLSPGLTPDEGRQNTTFTYTVTYVDNDQYSGVRGNPPEYVRVYIDNQQYDMQPVNPNDTDFTAAGGGATYQFTTASLVEGTRHTYFFIASDGLDLARLPAASQGQYSGPVVDEPPDPPKQLVVADTPNDNGGSLDFNFNAALDDGGGPDDVTEYHLYRNTTGPPFTGDPILVIRADNSPSYAGRDTAAQTGLQTGVDYFYMVRAYDGPTIDPDGNGVPDRDQNGALVVPVNPESQSVDSNVEGPVRAVDSIAPAPPSGLTVIDPGTGSALELAWNPSPDDGAGANDVREYRIYRNSTGAPFTGAPIATVAAGTTTYRDGTTVDGTQYYYMLRAFDGSNTSVDSNVAGPATSSDSQAPEIINLNPAPNATNVARNTNITFDVRDTGSGVRANALVLRVNGVTVTPTVSGSGTQVKVTYDPPSDFDFGSSVSVHIEASDLAVVPNTRILDYQFTITDEPTYTIAGTVLDRGGAPVANVVVRAGAFSATTNSNGTYVISGLGVGTYTVVPKLTDRAFTPETRNVTLGPSASGVDFVADIGYDITGRITRPDGTGIGGVRVSDGLHESITTSAGDFAILDIAAGQYTVVPQLTGYQFTPPSRDVSLPTSAPGGNAALTFEGDLLRFSVSGNIRTAAGGRLGGVSVQALDDGGHAVASATTNDNGQFTLRNVPGGAYSLVPTKAGWTFEPESKRVDVASDKTNVDFVATPVYTYRLGAGLSMVSLPLTPRKPNPADNVPSTVDVARWDPTRQPPGYLYGVRGGDVPDQLRMEPGRSFWMRNRGAAVDLAVAGDPVDTGIPFNLSLEQGWNMCGAMFDAPLPWGNLNISSGQSVRDYGFIYNPSTGSYELVTDSSGIGVASVVPKNAGFWIRSDARRVVTVTPVTSAEVADVTPAVKLGSGDFLLPIVVRAAGRADTCSMAGVIQGGDGYRVENPPAVSPYVDLYFEGGNGERLACDVRPATADTQSWRFVVATDMPGARVELSLPDLSRVPRDKTVTLVDTTVGKRVYARTMNSYSFTADESGLRRFILEIGPHQSGTLVVSAAQARASGTGVVISYSLSKPATVTARILNVAGRTQCVLSSGGVAPAGVNTLTWNLKTATGTRVPAGRYIIVISGAAEDGQAAQAVASVQVGAP